MDALGLRKNEYFRQEAEFLSACMERRTWCLAKLKLWKLSFGRAKHNGVSIDQGSLFEMSLQSIAEYLEPAQDRLLSKGLHLYRGVNLPNSDDIRADLGKNIWVFSSEERAREYMRAFEDNAVKVIFVFTANRELRLSALRLNAVTRHLYLSNHFSGTPQTYQRDKLIADLETILLGSVDGDI